MWHHMRTFLVRTHWPIVLAMLALMGVGVAAIGISERAEGTESNFADKQTIFAVLGLAVYLAMTSLPYGRIGKWAYVILAVTMGLLLVVLVLPPIRGSRRWIDLKIILLQPSEIAKLAFIILLAWYLRRGDNYRRLRGLAWPFVFTLVPMGLILAEPDLGTALLLLPTLYVMLFAAGARLRHLLGIVAVGAVAVFMPLPRAVTADMGPVEAADRRAMAYHVGREPWTFHSGQTEYIVSAAPLSLMKHHQVKRIEGWLKQNDPRVARGKGYQLYQSKMILATGKLSGRGGWGDAEAYFHLLPDDHTDFIFSVIGGQWGLAGCLGVLGLYVVLFVCGLEIASVTDDAFGRLVAIGVVALLFSQICINVGMTVGLMPITGMTLPLVSYGGSSLVVNCAALGLLVNVGRHRPILLGRKPFEHGRKDRQAALTRQEAMEPSIGSAPAAHLRCYRSDSSRPARILA